MPKKIVYGDIATGFNELIKAYAAELMLHRFSKLPHQPPCRKICHQSIPVLSFPDFINGNHSLHSAVWFMEQEYTLEKDTSF